MRTLAKLEFAIGLLFFAIPASSADIAILHNGFSIRHERRENNTQADAMANLALDNPAAAAAAERRVAS